MNVRGARKLDRIVQTADLLFYEKGYNRTSFSDIADATGIGRGNFYHYFKSKDSILDAVIEYRMRAIAQQIGAWEAAHAEPLARLKCFVDILRGSEFGAVRYGCPLGTLNSELGKAGVEGQIKTRRLFETFERWLERQFAALGHPEQANALALRLLCYTQGISGVAHAYGRRDLLHREADQLDTWLEAIAGKAPRGSQARLSG
jgi:TetR/AcrR family transcriptional regulator, transcriptional repressor for nem operon